MHDRITNRLRFQVERLVLRGAHYRLLVIAAAIGLIAVLAGLLVYGYSGSFASPAQAIWWAFLRMTDPGYLGDDEGVLLRVVSTVLTVLGFVLFVGALIAILTQWMNQSIRTLESGFTPVALRNHVVLLGWTNRTPAIVRELVLAEGRLRRFLRLHGARGLRIAILADDVGAELRQELRDRLGRLWKERQTVLRSGSPLRVEHLRRVDYANAAAILIPARDFRQAGASADAGTVKTLLSMGGHRQDGARDLPLVVAEIFDARKIPVVRAAYPGRLELLASDAIISRLIAQNIRHDGLSHVYGELLTHGRGNQIYVREHVRFVGERFGDLRAFFPHAVLLGIARVENGSFQPVLNAPADLVIQEGDRLAMLARKYAETDPATSTAAPPPGRAPAPIPDAENPSSPALRRVLLLGWSHRLPALIRELDSYADERFEVDVLSGMPAADRDRLVDRYAGMPERVRLRQLEGDYAAPKDLRRIDPGAYDNVVLVGNDWMESGEEADARTILGYMMLRGLLSSGEKPQILIELLDPENLPLLRRRGDEVLISPMVLSHMLAQVALRPEVHAIFEELFGPGGAEINFIPARRLGLVDRRVSFLEIEAAATTIGRTAIGIRRAEGREQRGGGVLLNPPREQVVQLVEADDVVVVETL